MNLFWQITMIELLLNVAVFAGAIIFYRPVRIFVARFSGTRESMQKVASGILFGGATVVALLLPIHLEGGAAIGCSTILLALIGPLDGSLAILGGLGLSVAVELLPWASKEGSNRSAIVSLLVASAVGFAFRWVLTHRSGHRNKQLHYFHLPLLGLLSAAGGLAILTLTEGVRALANSVMPAIVSNIFAAVILGTLLLHEKDRSETEHELRESEARFARQANALAVACDAAEGTNRAKSMFIANMSHELRTPLNAILGYAQLLKRDRNLTKWQWDASNTIQQSGEHLLTLITDILDLSKIEAGKIEIQLSPVDMTSFLRGICNIIRIKAEEKGLAFDCDIAPDVPAYLQTDQKHLRQVLLNLLSNAVKFTDEGRVDLRVRVLSPPQTEASLRFEVSDTGTGIAGDQLETIFQPFEQVADASHRAGGTGLGLGISQQLVRLMGGEVRVESSLGHGSCFSFEMTAMLVTSTIAASPMSRDVTGYAGLRRRILVVDDTEANRAVLTEILDGLGFEISQAINGSEALSSAQETLPDLILMDIRMPVMGGVEAMRCMQQIPNLRCIPIIAVSAGVSQSDQADSMSAGAKAFLTKPIENTRMLLEIGNLLDLIWTFAPSQQRSPTTDNLTEQFVVPEPAAMESLRELAKAGNMRAIREKADQLAALDIRYRPFAEKISVLALGYQSKAVLRLVEKHATPKQVNQS